MANPTRKVTVKFDGDTKGLAVAAKQGERIVDKFADNTARTFTSRFRSWFTGRGADESNSIGQFFARTFGTGLLSGFSVPVFGPLMLAALVGVVAVIAPVIGAALAAGIVSAFGAGLVGFGVVFAAQSQQVKSAFGELKDSLVSDLRLLSKPFEDTLVQIAGFIQRTFEAFAPTLRSVFAALAPIITTFADQFFRALEKFKPAVEAIGDAFGDLLTALGPKLGPLFDDIADSIEGIAQTVSENDEAFASLITFFGNVADVALEATGKLAGFFGALAQLDKEISESKNPFLDSSRGVADWGKSVDEAAPAAGKLRQSFDGVKTSIQGATQALTDYAAAQQAATDPVFALIDAVTRADDAQTAYNDAVKEYGATSPEATAAAVDQAQAVANLEQAALNGEVSFSAFSGKLREWVASGKITAAQAEAIRTKVAGARGEAEDFKGNYEATIIARDKATSVLANIRAWLASIQSKTVTITARSQIPAGVSVRQLMDLPGRQHGGPVTAGRSYLVGEKAPEILTMGGQGGQVSPLKAVGNGGGTATMTLVNHGVIGSQFELENWLVGAYNTAQRKGRLP